VSTDYAFDIETLLNESLPESILAIGPNTGKLVADYVEQKRFLKRPCEVSTIEDGDLLAQLEALCRFDIGIVMDMLQHMDKSRGCQLIARLRDLHTPRFCVVVPMGADWQGHESHWEPADLLGLGMSRVNVHQHDDKPVHVYKYDIATYKKTPDWLNAKDWANPELWDKYRW
jgi:hypothetical protein